MRTLNRYLARELVGAILLVFAALLMLFAFFDLLHELGDVGKKGSYSLGFAVLHVLLSVPGHVYELFPIAALIGATFALAQLSAHSEFTVIRVSGVSVQRMALSLVRVGAVFAAVNFAFGEFVAPPSERLAQQLRVRATSNVVAQEFRSGLWVKDELSFINVSQVLPDATLLGIKIYEFDNHHRLRTISFARQGEFESNHRWRLSDVVQTRFNDTRVSVQTLATAEWHSVLKPDILAVLLVNPEQMSAVSLYSYIQHLNENRQKTVRYEIALWTKLVYPLTVLVMMVLALPFAIYQTRTVGVGTKIFAGIMLGLSFYLVSRLSANLGAINDWPPVVSALLPTLLYFGAAMGMMWWVEKR